MADKKTKEENVCGTIRKKKDPYKYRISFSALERTQGAEDLRSDAEVSIPDVMAINHYIGFCFVSQN